ncbi:Phage Mu protein F like protein [compost metagenome]
MVQQRMGVSRTNAARLVRTESAHMVGEATFKGYEQSGVVKQYQFLATLDTRTSTICQSMDNRVFPLSEKQVGVNYPPLHANCRSTTVAYFDDDDDIGERVARGEDGKYYYVPESMNYKEWYEKYVDAA